MRRAPLALAGFLLVAVLVPGAAAASADPISGPGPGIGAPIEAETIGVGPTATRPEEGVVQEITYRRDPGNESSVLLDVAYSAGSDVSSLTLFPPDRATLVSTTSFERQDNGRLNTGENFDEASATFRLELPAETVDDHWGTGVATGEWTVVGGLPGTAYRSTVTDDWEHEDDERVTRELSIVGKGLAGSRTVVLGEHTVYERTVDGQRLRLVVPPGHTPDASPERILDALAFTARTLDVGARDESVLLVYIPVRSSAVTGTLFSERRGQQDVWLYSPGWGIENTWIHEYVHTRQDYELARDMRWFGEASANYYEKLFALRSGAGSYDAFGTRIESNTAGGVLADPDRWHSGTRYVRGQRVLAALDARIQNETGYERSLADVFRLVNDHEGALSLADFTDYVSSVAGTDLSGWIVSHVAGTADPGFTDDPYAYTSPSGTDDPDGDGLADARERELGTHPFRTDTDEDGLNDSAELDRGTDPTQSDSDGDGLADGREVELGTDPTVNDTDGDGLADGREVELGTDPMANDSDGDGLADGREVELGADPTVNDTDGDGLVDGREVELGADPTAKDTDDDGLPDGREAEIGTDPAVADTDEDGLTDAREVGNATNGTDGKDAFQASSSAGLGTDPLDPDTDDDDLEDGPEVDEYGTDPTEEDTDGDGYPDGREVNVGTDPTESTDRLTFVRARVGDGVLLAGVGLVGALIFVGIATVAFVLYRL